MIAGRETDAAARLWWVVRRYRVALVLLVAGGLGLGLVQGYRAGTDLQYEASALVVVSNLGGQGDARIVAEQLPKFAEAVFRAGGVARAAAASPEIPFAAEQLVPEYARVEPIAGTIAVRVIGLANTRELAATIANEVARALTAALNRAGAGFGSFRLAVPAEPPEFAADEAGLRTPLTIGFLASLSFALGAAALVAAVRRPVITPGHASAVAALPVLATIRLPRGRRPVEPGRVMGLRSLVARLYAPPRRLVAFVSCGGADRERTALATCVAAVLSESGEVRLVGSSGAGRHASAGDDEHGSRRYVVVDGPSADDIDVEQFLPPGAAVVLVVREGIAESRLEEPVAQFSPGTVEGIVFVRRGGRRFRRHRSEQATERLPAFEPAVGSARAEPADRAKVG